MFGRSPRPPKVLGRGFSHGSRVFNRRPLKNDNMRDYYVEERFQQQQHRSRHRQQFRNKNKSSINIVSKWI